MAKTMTQLNKTNQEELEAEKKKSNINYYSGEKEQSKGKEEESSPKGEK